jgi:hypothetical protein
VREASEIGGQQGRGNDHVPASLRKAAQQVNAAELGGLIPSLSAQCGEISAATARVVAQNLSDLSSVWWTTAG